MKKIALATLLLVLSLGAAVSTNAQTTKTATPVPTTAGPTSSVQAYIVVCSDSAILNFTGDMVAGYDIYYQVFSGSTGSGTALTGVRQVPVDGTFAVSDRVVYNTGLTVATGGVASANVSAARTSNPSSVAFSFVVSDVQDGCNNPQNQLIASADLGGSGGGGATADTTSGSVGFKTSIMAPGGSALNPNLKPEDAVVIGDRLSDHFRSDTAGLIFAECDAYPLAEPGIIYDNDTVTIYWSWFTKTQAEMQQHIDNALYTVHLNTANLPMTTRSTPTLIGGNYWVFFTATVGHLRPGHYEVGYLVQWANPVNDGYSDYGPGTSRTRQNGICNFDVKQNPDGQTVPHTGMYFPSTYPVHNINKDY